ncbi:uncharacterized protein [Paramisgurnus dabryanus]|uniref:uncharacterized protein n=1 Tax=Paramisgurnus dabryanus TaxID=90735 RepID=UPI003CCF875D
MLKSLEKKWSHTLLVSVFKSLYCFSNMLCVTKKKTHKGSDNISGVIVIGALNDPDYANVAAEICDLNMSSGLGTSAVNDENLHNNIRSSDRDVVWGVAGLHTLVNLSNLLDSIPNTSGFLRTNENGVCAPTTRHNDGRSGIRKPLSDLSILVDNIPHTIRGGHGSCKRQRSKQAADHLPRGQHTTLRNADAKRQRTAQSASPVLNASVIAIDNVAPLESDARTSGQGSSTHDIVESFVDWDEDLINAWDACDFELPTPSQSPSESMNVQETPVASEQTPELGVIHINQEDNNSEDTELSPSVLTQSLDVQRTVDSEQATAVVQLNREEIDSEDTELYTSVMTPTLEIRSVAASEQDPEPLPGNQQAYRNELADDEQVTGSTGNEVTLEELKDFLHYVWYDYTQFKQFVVYGFSNQDTERRKLFELITEIITLLKKPTL